MSDVKDIIIVEEIPKKVEKDKIYKRKNFETKEKRSQLFSFVSSMLLTLLVSILSTIGSSSSFFMEKPFFLWLVGLIVILFLIIGIAPKLFRLLSSIPADKETLLKEQIISAFSISLDKTILNPKQKYNAE